VILTRAGDAYRSLGELDLAEEYYHQALDIEFDLYAVIGLAMINKEKGNHLEVIESLTGLLVNNPKNSRLILEIADAHLELGNTERARDVLTRFVRLGGKHKQISGRLEKINKSASHRGPFSL
jgi:tetratricopeptide (TPR) repeat protein